MEKQLDFPAALGYACAMMTVAQENSLYNLQHAYAGWSFQWTMTDRFETVEHNVIVTALHVISSPIMWSIAPDGVWTEL